MYNCICACLKKQNTIQEFQDRPTPGELLPIDVERIIYYITIKISLMFRRKINRLCFHNLFDILLGYTSDFLKMIVLHNMLLHVAYNSYTFTPL